MSARYRLYRFHHEDGSSKDWAIRATEEAVIVRYGKTGRAGRLHEVPHDAKTFRAGTPDAEADRRIGEQLRQGYVYVGEATFDSRGLARTESEPARPQRLYWTVEVPAGIDMQAWTEAVLSRAGEIGQTLCNHRYVRRCQCDADTVVIYGHDALGFCFGFSERPESGRISPSTRRGSGSASATRVAEVLFLLALAKSFPEFALADDEGEVIEPGLADNPLLADGATHHERVAEALGLAPARIHWDAITAPTPSLFY